MFIGRLLFFIVSKSLLLRTNAGLMRVERIRNKLNSRTRGDSLGCPHRAQFFP